MKVTVVFEFHDITDPNTAIADEIVQTLTVMTKQWQEEFNAVPPYKGYGDYVTVWVEEAQ